MYSIFPWDMEFSDGVTGPYMFVPGAPQVFDPHVLSAVDMLPVGQTGYFALPAHRRREEQSYDHNGVHIPWSGNQDTVVEGLVRKLEASAV